MTDADPLPRAAPSAETTMFTVILAISFCHLLNDMMQSLLPAIYPNLKAGLGLSFTQVGLLTFAYQFTASILQPVVGLYGDKRPTPMLLAGGTLFNFTGLIVLATAHAYPVLLAGACMMGMGSSTFHPESSRVARMAAGPRRGLAQSLFQVGGNAGTALGPLAAAIVVVRYGQSSVGAFAAFAVMSCVILINVGRWTGRHGQARLSAGGGHRDAKGPLPRAQTVRAIVILLVLIFSKYVYLASISSYFTFYLIHRFGLSVQNAQLHLFAFLAAIAVGTLCGGALGDRFGRKRVIWLSILGVLPFTLLMPYASLFWTGPLSVIVGLLLASAFPAIVVFAQELVPGRVGMISGLFFGFSFGMGGIGASVLGYVADVAGIETVYRVCAFLPALGILAALLPDLKKSP